MEATRSFVLCAPSFAPVPNVITKARIGPCTTYKKLQYNWNLTSGSLVAADVNRQQDSCDCSSDSETPNSDNDSTECDSELDNLLSCTEVESSVTTPAYPPLRCVWPSVPVLELLQQQSCCSFDLGFDPQIQPNLMLGHEPTGGGRNVGLSAWFTSPAASTPATQQLHACSKPSRTDQGMPDGSSTRHAKLSLPQPTVMVGYQEDWLETAPAMMRLWEKVPLEPYAGPKSVLFYVLCPDVLKPAAIAFFQDLSNTYECCNLGLHSPASTCSLLAVQGGIITVPYLGHADAARAHATLVAAPSRAFTPQDDERIASGAAASTSAAAPANGAVRQQDAQRTAARLEEYLLALRGACEQLQRTLILSPPNLRSASMGLREPHDAALVVYLIPPPDLPDAEMRVFLEAATCLAPVTPAGVAHARPRKAAVNAPACGTATHQDVATGQVNIKLEPLVKMEPLTPLEAAAGRSEASTPSDTSVATPLPPPPAMDCDEWVPAEALARFGAAAHCSRVPCQGRQLPTPRLEDLSWNAVPVTLQVVGRDVLRDVSCASVRSVAFAVYNKARRRPQAGEAAGPQAQLYEPMYVLSPSPFAATSAFPRDTPDLPPGASTPSGRLPGPPLLPPSSSSHHLVSTPTGALHAAPSPRSMSPPVQLVALSTNEPPPRSLHCCFSWCRNHGHTHGYKPVGKVGRRMLGLAMTDSEGELLQARLLNLDRSDAARVSDAGHQAEVHLHVGSGFASGWGFPERSSSWEAARLSEPSAASRHCQAGVGTAAPVDAAGKGVDLALHACRTVLMECVQAAKAMAHSTGGGGHGRRGPERVVITAPHGPSPQARSCWLSACSSARDAVVDAGISEVVVVSVACEGPLHIDSPQDHPHGPWLLHTALPHTRPPASLLPQPSRQTWQGTKPRYRPTGQVLGQGTKPAAYRLEITPEITPEDSASVLMFPPQAPADALLPGELDALRSMHVDLICHWRAASQPATPAMSQQPHQRQPSVDLALPGPPHVNGMLKRPAPAAWRDGGTWEGHSNGKVAGLGNGTDLPSPRAPPSKRSRASSIDDAGDALQLLPQLSSGELPIVVTPTGLHADVDNQVPRRDIPGKPSPLLRTASGRPPPPPFIPDHLKAELLRQQSADSLHQHLPPPPAMDARSNNPSLPLPPPPPLTAFTSPFASTTAARPLGQDIGPTLAALQQLMQTSPAAAVAVEMHRLAVLHCAIHGASMQRRCSALGLGTATAGWATATAHWPLHVAVAHKLCRLCDLANAVQP